MSELKRKQSTAVILLGVIGAEFGQDITGTDNNKKRSNDDRRKSSIVEGFGKNFCLLLTEDKFKWFLLTSFIIYSFILAKVK